MLHRTIKNAKYRARTALGGHPVGYRLLATLYPRDLVVSRRTDLCVEGFERSANSFLCRAVARWNKGIRLAHHLHAPQQILRAMRLGIPCVMLVRPPLAALSSVLLVDDTLTTANAVRGYLAFYEPLLGHLDEVAIARFEDVTKRPETVIATVNERFGSAFRSQPLTGDDRAKIDAQLRRRREATRGPEHLVAVPTAEKERLRGPLLDRLRAEPALTDAAAMYESIVGSRVPPP